MPRDRLTKPDPELLAKAMALAPKYAKPQMDGMGRFGFFLIAEQSPEFKALKIKTHPQFASLRPANTPLAALLGLLPPEVLRGEYPTYRDAVTAAMTTLHEGDAYFYGMQTSAICYKDAALAEEIVRAERITRWLLCFDNELFDVIGPERLDELLLERTEKWTPNRDMLVWGLLEHHKAWSVALSDRLIAGVRDQGAQSGNVMWQFGGNGYATAMHPERIEQAIEALEPWWRTQGNAKRWRKKLKDRLKR